MDYLVILKKLPFLCHIYHYSLMQALSIYLAWVLRPHYVSVVVFATTESLTALLIRL